MAHGKTTRTTCGDCSVTNTYDADGQLTAIVDSVSGTTTMTYGSKGNVTSVTAPDHTEVYTYDGVDEKQSTKTITAGDTTHTYRYGFSYAADQKLPYIVIDDEDMVLLPVFDALGRSTDKLIRADENDIAEKRINYVKTGDHATPLPSTVRFIADGKTQERMQYRRT